MTKTRTISIVDDDASMRGALMNQLRSAGYEADAYASAEVFLASERAGDSACLILDVRMPGMGGLELQRRLAEGGSRVPVIFVTAHGDEATRELAIREGALEVLSKPVADDVLLEAVNRALERERGDGTRP